MALPAEKNYQSNLSSMNRPDNIIDFNQKRRELNRARMSEQQNQLTPEAQQAEILRQGAPMQGISESAGLTGGSAGNAAWPQPPAQAVPENEKPEAGTAEKAAKAGQAAGTAMKAGGKGMQLGGKAMEAGGKLAGKGFGGVIGGLAGGATGVLGGPEGIAAGARAGAKAGAKAGGELGALPGKGVKAAGKGVEKTGDTTKDFSRRLRRALKRDKKPEKKEESAFRKATDKALQKPTAALLRSAWISQISIVGVVSAFWAVIMYCYIVFHFLMAYFTPLSNFFCKFGKEWTDILVPEPVEKMANKNLTKKMKVGLELGEIFLLLFLGLLYTFVIFALAAFLAILIYVWTHPYEVAVKMGFQALKMVWNKIIGYIGL